MRKTGAFKSKKGIFIFIRGLSTRLQEMSRSIMDRYDKKTDSQVVFHSIIGI